MKMVERIFLRISWREWFLLIGVVFFLSFVFIRYAEPVKDGDLWFHMAYGRFMIEYHTLVPDHGVYSWTPADSNQIYCAWIPEIILFLLFNAWGLPALFTLKYTGVCIFLLFVLIFMKKNNSLLNPLAWLMTLTGVLMCQSAMDIKPELFSFVLMTIMVWTWFMIRSSCEKRWMYCYLFPLIMIIWVNSHGGFIFGLVFLMLVSTGEIMNYFFSPDERLDAATGRHFFFSMLLSLLVIFITPYGWKYPLQLFDDLVLNSADQIKEFKTVRAYQSIFHPKAGAHHFIDYLIISSSVLVFLFCTSIKQRRMNWSLLLGNIGLAFLYIQFIRTTYFWGILCVFSSIELLGREGIGFSLKDGRVKRYLGVFSIILCFLVAGREVYQTFCKPLFGFWINYYSPIEEAEYIRNNLSGYRLGNDYNSGAYLLWALWPETKIFIDARYFPYKKWYQEYAAFVYGNDDKYKNYFLDKYGCDLWCATYDFPQLSYFTSSSEWRLVHYGPSACIFVRKGLPIPDESVKLDKSLFNVRTNQALKILDFSLSIGDIENAVFIAKNLKKSRICPKINSEIALFYIKLGDALEKKDRIDMAIPFFEESLNISPIHEASVYSALGSLYMNKGELDNALLKYNEALDIQPDYAPAVHNIALIYSQRGDLDRALVYMKMLVEIQPEDPDNYYNLACVYSLQFNIDDAIACLDTAMKKGFNRWELLKSDEDLANLRVTEYYRNIVDSKSH